MNKRGLEQLPLSFEAYRKGRVIQGIMPRPETPVSLTIRVPFERWRENLMVEFLGTHFPSRLYPDEKAAAILEERFDVWRKRLSVNSFYSEVLDGITLEAFADFVDRRANFAVDRRGIRLVDEEFHMEVEEWERAKRVASLAAERAKQKQQSTFTLK